MTDEIVKTDDIVVTDGPATSHETVKWSGRDGYIGYTRESALTRIETATQRLVKELNIDVPVMPSYPNDLAYDFAHKMDYVATLLENVVNAVAPQYQKQADKVAAKEKASTADDRRVTLESYSYPVLVNLAHQTGIDPDILMPASGAWKDEEQARAAIIKALLATDVPSYALPAEPPSLDDSVIPSFVSTPALQSAVDEDTAEAESVEDETDDSSDDIEGSLYSSYTKKELKALAYERNVDIHGLTSNAAIIEALEKAESK